MNRKEEDALIREQFPLLRKHPELAYLDSAATAQKPSCVMEAERRFYEEENANPMRGLYALSEAATEAYEDARKTVQRFIGAAHADEIIFTRNTTESLNLAAFCLSEALLSENDEILISIREHHSNLIPWQQAAKRKGAQLRYLECDAEGRLTPEMLKEAMSARTKIVAVAQTSNVLGGVVDLRAFADICHENGAVLVADGAQSVPHMPVDVQALDVDFLAFSGHKLYGPMGIGVLYGKRALLKKLPPYMTGGEMIDSVTREGAVFAELPHKFEAGTVNAAGAVGLAEAIRYIERIGFDVIVRREEALTKLAMDELAKIPHVRVLGPKDAAEHHGIITFVVEGVHPHDVAEILSNDGIAVRAGHHCAQPLHQFLGVPSSTRASLAFYNTEEEILKWTEALRSVRSRMGYADENVLQ